MLYKILFVYLSVLIASCASQKYPEGSTEAKLQKILTVENCKRFDKAKLGMTIAEVEKAWFPSESGYRLTYKGDGSGVVHTSNYWKLYFDSESKLVKKITNLACDYY